MAAQFVAQPQRGFEVEPRTRLPAAGHGAACVSPEMSTVNQASPAWPPRSITVRHTPEQAIEVPMAIVSGS